jgi:hypothetical protein
MHSNLKGRKDVDLYCPLDLYSGDLSRTKNAILQLMKLDESNNWKVFLNSARTSPCQHAKIFIDLFPDMYCPQELLGEIIAKILIRDKVLEKLKYHQRKLDGFGGIQDIKRAADSAGADLNPDFNDIDLDMVLTRYLAGYEELEQKIIEHIFSMTLKDCVYNSHLTKI